MCDNNCAPKWWQQKLRLPKLRLPEGRSPPGVSAHAEHCRLEPMNNLRSFTPTSAPPPITALPVSLLHVLGALPSLFMYLTLLITYLHRHDYAVIL